MCNTNYYVRILEMLLHALGTFKIKPALMERLESLASDLFYEGRNAGLNAAQERINRAEAKVVDFDDRVEARLTSQATDNRQRMNVVYLALVQERLEVDTERYAGILKDAENRKLSTPKIQVIKAVREDIHNKHEFWVSLVAAKDGVESWLAQRLIDNDLNALRAKLTGE